MKVSILRGPRAVVRAKTRRLTKVAGEIYSYPGTVCTICYPLGKRKIKLYVFVFVWFCLKTLALASVAQLAVALFHSQKVVDSIPGQGTYI